MVAVVTHPLSIRPLPFLTAGIRHSLQQLGRYIEWDVASGSASRARVPASEAEAEAGADAGGTRAAGGQLDGRTTTGGVRESDVDEGAAYGADCSRAVTTGRATLLSTSASPSAVVTHLVSRYLTGALREGQEATGREEGVAAGQGADEGDCAEGRPACGFISDADVAAWRSAAHQLALVHFSVSADGAEMGRWLQVSSARLTALQAPQCGVHTARHLPPHYAVRFAMHGTDVFMPLGINHVACGTISSPTAFLEVSCVVAGATIGVILHRSCMCSAERSPVHLMSACFAPCRPR